MKGTFSDYLNQKKSNLFTEKEIPEIDLNGFLRDNEVIKRKLEERIKQRKSNWDIYYNQTLTWCLTGFNILFYGYGSKRNFLDGFVKEYIKGKYIALTIRGYFKQIKFKACLLELLNVINNFDDKIIDRIPSNEINDWNIEQIITRIEVIINNFSTYNRNIFIIIHNIDSLSLRTHLSAISQLAQAPCINIVATVDNIRWPLLWNSSMRCKMNFLYMNISTLEEYDVEFKYLFEDQIPPWLNSLENETNEKYNLESFNSILSCLTPTHIQLTKIIANLQLENDQVTEELLFETLKSSMIVTNKSAFSQILVELLTHEIVIKEYSNNKSENSSGIVYKLKLSDELIRELLNKVD